jgi:hypothetical protein
MVGFLIGLLITEVIIGNQPTLLASIGSSGRTSCSHLLVRWSAPSWVDAVAFTARREVGGARLALSARNLPTLTASHSVDPPPMLDPVRCYMTSMIGKRALWSRQAAAKRAVPRSPVNSE